MTRAREDSAHAFIIAVRAANAGLVGGMENTGLMIGRLERFVFPVAAGALFGAWGETAGCPVVGLALAALGTKCWALLLAIEAGGCAVSATEFKIKRVHAAEVSGLRTN